MKIDAWFWACIAALLLWALIGFALIVIVLR